MFFLVSGIQHPASGIRNPASSFEDTQSPGFLNRLSALVDVELLVDVLQVSFDGCG